jgi:hypothetical protein
MRINLEDTLFCLVDVQERLFPHIGNKKELLKKINRLKKELEYEEGEELEDFKLKSFYPEEKLIICCSDSLYLIFDLILNKFTSSIEDDVPEEVKQARVEEIMELQSQISWEKNQEKIGKTYRCIFDRKEGNYFVGRTEYDSPDVDNTVLVEAKDTYISIGEFVNIKITSAEEFDLYGEIAE